MRFKTPTNRGTLPASSTIHQIMRAVDIHRRRQALPSLVDTRTRQLLRAMRHLRPVGEGREGVLPINLPRLIAALPLDDSFFAVRLRALFLLRLVTLLRPSEPLSIKRSTIQAQRHPHDAGRLVLLFDYTSKSSARVGRAGDKNYVEFLADSSDNLVYCPARALLALQQRVEVLPDARSHDSIITDEKGRQLGRDRCSTIIRDFMHRNGAPSPWKSHDMRGASNQLLLARGVPVETVATRAGWHARTGDATQSRHYTTYRLVAVDFAAVIIDGRVVT